MRCPQRCLRRRSPAPVAAVVVQKALLVAPVAAVVGAAAAARLSRQRGSAPPGLRVSRCALNWRLFARAGNPTKNTQFARRLVACWSPRPPGPAEFPPQSSHILEPHCPADVCREAVAVTMHPMHPKTGTLSRQRKVKRKTRSYLQTRRSKLQRQSKPKSCLLRWSHCKSKRSLSLVLGEYVRLQA